MRLRYEKVVGQLDFNNFIASANLSSTGVTAGNENIKPDQHSQYELSMERHFWDKGAVVLTFMHEDIKDVVDFVPIKDALGNMFDAPGNIGNGQDNQITFQATLPLDRIFIPNGLLTTTSIFNLTSVRDPVTGVQPRDLSAAAPEYQCEFFTGHRQPEIDLGHLLLQLLGRDIPTGSRRRATERLRRPISRPSGNTSRARPGATGFELNNFTSFVYHDNNFTFAGPRNTSPLIGVDEYNGQSHPAVRIPDQVDVLTRGA